MLLQPLVQIEVVILLAPEHPGQRLAVYAAFILGERTRGDPIIELVRIREAGDECLVKSVERVGRRFQTQAQPYDLAAACGYVQTIMRSSFRARLERIHSLCLA